MSELTFMTVPVLSVLYTALYFYNLHSMMALMQKVHYFPFALELGASESFYTLPKVTQQLHRTQNYEPRAA